MPKKTITKNLFVVISLAVLSVFAGSCSHLPVSGGEPPEFDREKSPYGETQTAGRVESDEITESSGIAASKCQPNVLWTHNDSGDGPFVFAMDENGRDLGTWKIENAENRDWEDIAAVKEGSGKCFLYLGDTGNEKKKPRNEHKIYRVAEPEIQSSPGTSRKEPALTAPAETIVFSYPDGPHDAETLIVHPGTGEIYVVTKQRDTAAGVYKLKPAFNSTVATAQKIGDLTVPAIPNGFLTGGDIAPDGRRMLICDYFAAYEFSLPEGTTNFDEIWKQKPVVINLGDRKQGEAIGYSADGLSLFATSEGKNQPIMRVKKLKQ